MSSIVRRVKWKRHVSSLLSKHKDNAMWSLKDFLGELGSQKNEWSGRNGQKSKVDKLWKRAIRNEILQNRYEKLGPEGFKKYLEKECGEKFSREKSTRYMSEVIVREQWRKEREREGCESELSVQSYLQGENHFLFIPENIDPKSLLPIAGDSVKTDSNIQLNILRKSITYLRLFHTHIYDAIKILYHSDCAAAAENARTIVSDLAQIRANNNYCDRKNLSSESKIIKGIEESVSCFRNECVDYVTEKYMASALSNATSNKLKSIKGSWKLILDSGFSGYGYLNGETAEELIKKYEELGVSLREDRVNISIKETSMLQSINRMLYVPAVFNERLSFLPCLVHPQKDSPNLLGVLGFRLLNMRVSVGVSTVLTDEGENLSGGLCIGTDNVPAYDLFSTALENKQYIDAIKKGQKSHGHLGRLDFEAKCLLNSLIDEEENNGGSRNDDLSFEKIEGLMSEDPERNEDWIMEENEKGEINLSLRVEEETSRNSFFNKASLKRQEDVEKKVFPNKEKKVNDLRDALRKSKELANELEKQIREQEGIVEDDGSTRNITAEEINKNLKKPGSIKNLKNKVFTSRELKLLDSAQSVHRLLGYAGKERLQEKLRSLWLEKDRYFCSQASDIVYSLSVCSGEYINRVKHPKVFSFYSRSIHSWTSLDTFFIPKRDGSGEQGAVMLAINIHSRFSHVVILRDKSGKWCSRPDGENIRRALEQVDCQGILGKNIVSDLGKEYRAAEVMQWSKDTNRVHHFSPRNTPQSNGIAERRILSLKTLIARFYKVNKDAESERSLYQACSAINSTPSSALGGWSPANINFASVHDPTLHSLSMDSSLEADEERYSSDLLSRLWFRKAYSRLVQDQTMLNHLKRRLDSLKESYRVERGLKVGDKVRNLSKGNEWSDGYISGIAKSEHSNNYFIMNAQTGHTHKASSQYLELDWHDHTEWEMPVSLLRLRRGASLSGCFKKLDAHLEGKEVVVHEKPSTGDGTSAATPRSPAMQELARQGGAASSSSSSSSSAAAASAAGAGSFIPRRMNYRDPNKGNNNQNAYMNDPESYEFSPDEINEIYGETDNEKERKSDLQGIDLEKLDSENWESIKTQLGATSEEDAFGVERPKRLVTNSDLYHVRNFGEFDTFSSSLGREKSWVMCSKCDRWRALSQESRVKLEKIVNPIIECSDMHGCSCTLPDDQLQAEPADRYIKAEVIRELELKQGDSVEMKKSDKHRLLSDISKPDLGAGIERDPTKHSDVGAAADLNALTNRVMKEARQGAIEFGDRMFINSYFELRKLQPYTELSSKSHAKLFTMFRGACKTACRIDRIIVINGRQKVVVPDIASGNRLQAHVVVSSGELSRRFPKESKKNSEVQVTIEYTPVNNEKKDVNGEIDIEELAKFRTEDYTLPGEWLSDLKKSGKIAAAGYSKLCRAGLKSQCLNAIRVEFRKLTKQRDSDGVAVLEVLSREEELRFREKHGNTRSRISSQLLFDVKLLQYPNNLSLATVKVRMVPIGWQEDSDEDGSDENFLREVESEGNNIRSRIKSNNKDEGDEAGVVLEASMVSSDKFASPTLSSTQLRALLTIFTFLPEGATISTLDVSRAFLQSAPYEDNQCRILAFPFSASDPDQAGAMNYCAGSSLLCRIPLYGLKSASISWYVSLSSFLSELGLKSSAVCPAVFTLAAEDAGTLRKAHELDVRKMGINPYSKKGIERGDSNHHLMRNIEETRKDMSKNNLYANESKVKIDLNLNRAKYPGGDLRARKQKSVLWVGAHVDDLIVISSSQEVRDKFLEVLGRKFSFSDPDFLSVGSHTVYCGKRIEHTAQGLKVSSPEKSGELNTIDNPEEFFDEFGKINESGVKIYRALKGSLRFIAQSRPELGYLTYLISKGNDFNRCLDDIKRINKVIIFARKHQDYGIFFPFNRNKVGIATSPWEGQFLSAHLVTLSDAALVSSENTTVTSPCLDTKYDSVSGVLTMCINDLATISSDSAKRNPFFSQRSEDINALVAVIDSNSQSLSLQTNSSYTAEAYSLRANLCRVLCIREELISMNMEVQSISALSDSESLVGRVANGATNLTIGDAHVMIDVKQIKSIYSSRNVSLGFLTDVANYSDILTKYHPPQNAKYLRALELYNLGKLVIKSVDRYKRSKAGENVKR